MYQIWIAYVAPKVHSNDKIYIARAPYLTMTLVFNLSAEFWEFFLGSKKELSFNVSYCNSQQKYCLRVRLFWDIKLQNPSMDQTSMRKKTSAQKPIVDVLSPNFVSWT